MSIQTAADRAAGAAEERDWDEAREIVRAQYRDVAEGSERFWQLVMGVFKRMRGREDSRMRKAFSNLFGWLRGDPPTPTEHVVSRMLEAWRTEQGTRRQGEMQKALSETSSALAGWMPADEVEREAQLTRTTGMFGKCLSIPHKVTESGEIALDPPA